METKDIAEDLRAAYLVATGQKNTWPREYVIGLIERTSRTVALNARLREALRIACADAWPNQPQWPALYEARAAENLQAAALAQPQGESFSERYAAGRVRTQRKAQPHDGEESK